MTSLITLLICLCFCFFGAKSTVSKTKTESEKSGFDLQKACWAASKLLGRIVICGFLAAAFAGGHWTMPIFLLSIVATVLGDIAGLRKAAKENKK
jgi:hypothetical protein